MEVGFFPGHQLMIEDFLIQGVTEPIPRSNSSVWPFTCACELNKLVPPHQLRTPLLNLYSLFANSRRDRSSAELPARNTRCFEQSPLLRVKLLQLVFNELTQSIRQANLFSLLFFP